MGILRLLLALSVVAAHCGAIFRIDFVGGRIAVQAFYIISGFYMSIILNEKYIGQNDSYKLFISNRILRIYPIYWSVLLLTILFSLFNGIITAEGSFLRIDNYLKYFNSILTMLMLLFTQLFIIGQDIIMFLGFSPNSQTMYYTSNYVLESFPMHSFLFIPQAWTLGIEMYFFIIAPFILRKNWKYVFIFLILSMVIKLFIHFELNLKNDPWTYRFFPSEFMFFLIGYFCYKASCKFNKKIITKSLRRFLFLLLISFTIFYSKIPSFGYPLFLVEFFYFLVFIISLPFIFNDYKDKKWDNQIGELSFPVYISHVLIMMLFSISGFSHNGSLVAICCIMFSFLLNKYISKPIERYRQSRLVS